MREVVVIKSNVFSSREGFLIVFVSTD